MLGRFKAIRGLYLTQLSLGLLWTGGAWLTTRSGTATGFAAVLGVATLLAGGLAIARRRHGWLRSIVAAGGAVDGCAIALLIACIAGQLSLVSVVQVYLLLLAVALSLGGEYAAIESLRVPRLLSAACVSIAALLACTFPVWMPVSKIPPRVLEKMIEISPIMAVNGVVDPGVPFTQRPFAYQHVALGQDVGFRLPQSVWPSAAFHAALGGVGIAAAGLLRRSSGKDTADAA